MSSDDCFIFCADDEISISHLNKIVLQAKQLSSQTTEVEEGAYMKDEQMHVVYNSEKYTMFVNELSSGKTQYIQLNGCCHHRQST